MGKACCHAVFSLALCALLGATCVLRADDRDPTAALLSYLMDQAKTPAEKASVLLHQGDLEQAMPAQGLIDVGLVSNAHEAHLVRAGMAYSDFGKISPFKDWLTETSGFRIALKEEGVISPGRELYAVLQGPEGAIWRENPEIGKRKEVYAPLMKMLGGPVINPALKYGDILGFSGEKQTIPGTQIQIPKYPMFVGYMHEWQGVLKSYLDARQALEHGTGPLAGVVNRMEDYQVILEAIYGHNGSGPSRQEYQKWFHEKYGRNPAEHEIPFWTRAHEIVVKDAAGVHVPIFEGSLQKEKYAGSVRRSPLMKYAIFHKIMDRVDGVVHPEKIYREIEFLGQWPALSEAYFGGNYHGTVGLQRFTIEREIPQLVQEGYLTPQDAKILQAHARNQIRLAKTSLLERAKRIKFYTAEGHVIPALEIGNRAKEVSRLVLLGPDGRPVHEFTVGEKGKLVDATGHGADFFDAFRRYVFQPAYDQVKKDPAWKAGTAELLMADGPCGQLGLLALAGLRGH